MLSEKDKRIINQRTRKMLKSKKEFKEMIDTSLSPEVASKVWKDAHKRLARMYAEHMDLPKGVRTHTDQYIFPDINGTAAFCGNLSVLQYDPPDEGKYQNFNAAEPEADR